MDSTIKQRNLEMSRLKIYSPLCVLPTLLIPSEIYSPSRESKTLILNLMCVYVYISHFGL